jgi:hypothetical protein
MNVHGLNFNPFDTHNRKIDIGNNGTCQLIARKENKQMTVWRYYNCDSTECNGKTCYYNSDSSAHFCMDSDTLNFKYTSAMLQSKTNFKYGYFEMRVRFPDWYSSPYNAFHPAFWMYSATPTVPWSEIDIFEIHARTGIITDCIHVDASIDTIKYSSLDPIPTPPGEPFLNLSEWHTFGCLWTPDSIVFTIDQNWRRKNSVNYADTMMYLQAMPIIVENTVNDFLSCIAVDSTNALFPFVMELDYIKAWQPKMACDTNKTYCNVTQATFNSKLYKTLTIGGSGCSATFNNSKASAVATDYVLLQEGFEIGNNMDMLIDVKPCWSGQTIFNSTITSPTPPPADFYETYKKVHYPTE